MRLIGKRPLFCFFIATPVILLTTSCSNETSAPAALKETPTTQNGEQNGASQASEKQAEKATDGSPNATENSEKKVPALLVGDEAPKFQVGAWIKGEAIPKLASDQTYLIEFWATWCGPCIAAMPHVTELQEKYKDKLTVIGVNVHESKDTDVAAFVEKNAEKIGYRVVRDDQSADEAGAMALTWLKPAAQNGIPCTFVVSQGKISWIGHPMEIDEVLPKIVAGEWDLQVARADHLAKMELKAKISKLQSSLGKMIRAKDVEGVTKALDELAALNPAAAKNAGLMRFQIMLQMGQYDAAYGMNEQLFEQFKDQAMALNMIAWTIVDQRGLEKRDFPMALKFAQRASEITENKDGAILDTLARVYFEQGNIDQAIETQTLAVEFGDGQKAELARTLEKYREKKAAAAPPEEKPTESTSEDAPKKSE